MIGALIGAGASLLGGALGRRDEKKAIARQNEYNEPVNVRARAEAAGFNPLLFVGPGVGQQAVTGGSNYMGSAIADAGMLLADAVAKKKEATRVSALQQQNAELAAKVENLTLRPKVGGIYAQRQAVPFLGAALGRSASRGSPEDPVPDYVGDLARGPRADDLGQRPPRNPFDREPVMVPVRDIGGVPTQIPQPVAERLGLAPWGQMVIEDQETLYGDEGGQLLSIPRLGDAISYHASGRPPAPIRGNSGVKPYWVGPPKSSKPSKGRVTPLLPKGAKTRDVYREVFGK